MAPVVEMSSRAWCRCRHRPEVSLHVLLPLVPPANHDGSPRGSMSTSSASSRCISASSATSMRLRVSNSACVWCQGREDSGGGRARSRPRSAADHPRVSADPRRGYRTATPRSGEPMSRPRSPRIARHRRRRVAADRGHADDGRLDGDRDGDERRPATATSTVSARRRSRRCSPRTSRRSSGTRGSSEPHQGACTRRAGPPVHRDPGHEQPPSEQIDVVSVTSASSTPRRGRSPMTPT